MRSTRTFSAPIRLAGWKPKVLPLRPRPSHGTHVIFAERADVIAVTPPAHLTQQIRQVVLKRQRDLGGRLLDLPARPPVAETKWPVCTLRCVTTPSNGARIVA
jgi:hypothetical protein